MSTSYSLESPYLQGELTTSTSTPRTQQGLATSPFARVEAFVQTSMPEPAPEPIRDAEQPRRADTSADEAELETTELHEPQELEAEWLDRELAGMDHEVNLSASDEDESASMSEASATGPFGEVIEVEAAEHDREQSEVEAGHDAEESEVEAEHDAEAWEVEAEHDAGESEVDAEHDAGESEVDAEHDAGESEVEAEHDAGESEVEAEHDAEESEALPWLRQQSDSEHQRADDEHEALAFERETESPEAEHENGKPDTKTLTVTVLLDGAARPDDTFRLQSERGSYKKTLKAKDAVDIGSELRALRFRGVAPKDVLQLWHQRSTKSRRIAFMGLRPQDLTSVNTKPDSLYSYYALSTQVPTSLPDRYGNSRNVDEFLVAASPLLVDLEPEEPKF